MAGKSDQAGWRQCFEADLADQLERGGTMFGYDGKGRYVAATKGGEREVVPGTKGEATLHRCKPPSQPSDI